VAADRHAVIWTRAGVAPVKMGHLTVTDRQCRFTYEPDYLETGLPGLSVLYPTGFVGNNTLVWERTPYFDFQPQIQSLIPPASESNFQRRLILSYLEQQGRQPAPGFDSDWAILMMSGHGGIGHLDIFEDDSKASAWYNDAIPTPFFQVSDKFGLSLKEFLTWLDDDADSVLEALGPTPSVGGAIPKLLLSIPASGWDGRVALPRRQLSDDRTDIILKLEKETYPGIAALEALALEVHKEAGFETPRYWLTDINGIPAIAIERFDRTAHGKPIFTETLYSVMASGDRRITNHYSGTYDDIGRAFDRSPIPLVSHPAQSKQHLLKRLLLSFVTGNGDLHLENLSLRQFGDQIGFSPVYDPTPMRAYRKHDLMVSMSFGDYGAFGKGDSVINFSEALLHFSKNLGITRQTLRSTIETVLPLGEEFVHRMNQIESVPVENRKHLESTCRQMEQKLKLAVG